MRVPYFRKPPDEWKRSSFHVLATSSEEALSIRPPSALNPKPSTLQHYGSGCGKYQSQQLFGRFRFLDFRV